MVCQLKVQCISSPLTSQLIQDRTCWSMHNQVAVIVRVKTRLDDRECVQCQNGILHSGVAKTSIADVGPHVATSTISLDCTEYQRLYERSHLFSSEF